MVDIHSHILPGIDDGPQTIDESLAMLEVAAASGTTDIVATPHADSHFSFNEQTVSRLTGELIEQSKGLIKIHSGCDFHLNFDNLSDALKSPRKYTVNAGRYLMAELPDLAPLPIMRNALRRLIGLKLVPVITHPERNGALSANLRELEEWAADGCLVQITAQSLLGRFGQNAQRVSESLMNAKLVHFVASDAHDCFDRPPNLSLAYKHVSNIWGSERANALFIDNPGAVIRDEPIYLSAHPKLQLPKRRFAFWK